jgi:hypothetical protein
VTSILYHHAPYSALFASNGNSTSERAYCYKTISSSSELFVRGYFRVSVSGIADNDDRFYFMIFKAGTNPVAFAGWRMIGGVVKWNLIVRDGASWVNVYSAASPSLNQWYNVRLEWHTSDVGYGKLFVDDVLVCSAMNKNTANYGVADRVEIGLPELINCGATQIYADDLEIIVQSGPS